MGLSLDKGFFICVAVVVLAAVFTVAFAWLQGVCGGPARVQPSEAQQPAQAEQSQSRLSEQSSKKLSLPSPALPARRVAKMQV